MREVELKFKINRSESLDDVLLLLSDVGLKLTDSVRQDDQVFLLSGQIGKPIVKGSKLGCVRKQTKNGIVKYLMTVKVNGGEDLNSLEYEVEVDNPDEAVAIFKALGFVLDVQILKERYVGTLGEFALCLDEVEGLGIFIELEKIVDDNAMVGVVQAEMRRVLEELGLGGEVCKLSYEAMIREKKQ